jgi:acyl dehydratase
VTHTFDIVGMSLAEQRACIGQQVGTSHWVLVDQDMINRFAQVTLDPDPMHIDPEWSARHSPFGKTIAFGFLTTSLLTHLYHDVLQYDRHGHAQTGGYPLNYGFDRLRLIAPVPVGSRIRGHFTLIDVRERGPGEVVHKTSVVIEIEGQQKPALVGEWLGLWVTEPGHRRIQSPQPAA